MGNVEEKRYRAVEKWEHKAKQRDRKLRKRRSQDMVVRGRSIQNIVRAIVKRGKEKR